MDLVFFMFVSVLSIVCTLLNDRLNIDRIFKAISGFVSRFGDLWSLPWLFETVGWGNERSEIEID